MIWERDCSDIRLPVPDDLKSKIEFQNLQLDADLIFFPWLGVKVLDVFRSNQICMSESCSEVHLFSYKMLTTTPRLKPCAHQVLVIRPLPAIHPLNIVQDLEMELSELCAYVPQDRVLMVGEGRCFSFASAILRCFLACMPAESGNNHRQTIGKNLVVSTLNAQEVLLCQHGASNTHFLRDHGARVISHPVDATSKEQLEMMASDQSLADFVVFNFPHTGANQTSLGQRGLERSIESNRSLLDAFFAALSDSTNLVGQHTRIHVTLKSTRPYADWGLPYIARQRGFALLRKFAFPREFMGQSGYAHETTVRNLRVQVNLESAEVHEFIRLQR